jgi:hypothetical protein
MPIRAFLIPAIILATTTLNATLIVVVPTKDGFRFALIRECISNAVNVTGRIIFQKSDQSEIVVSLQQVKLFF